MITKKAKICPLSVKMGSRLPVCLRGGETGGGRAAAIDGDIALLGGASCPSTPAAYVFVYDGISDWVESAGLEIEGSFMPVDIDDVDNDGNSFDKNGNPINVRDYFLRDKEITFDAQREKEYVRCSHLCKRTVQ